MAWLPGGESLLDARWDDRRSARARLGRLAVGNCQVSRPGWCEPPDENDYRGGATVALAVEDIHASVEELREARVSILSDVEETPICHMVLIADPDGNRIFLHERKNGTVG